MPKGKHFIVAPTRAGVQLASAWRFFTQGDEFYAASENTVQVGKASFHRNFNWQYQIGTQMKRLVTNKNDGRWRHALLVQFQPSDDAACPVSDKHPKLIEIESPPQHKLMLNLYVSIERADPSRLESATVAGEVIAYIQLKSGRVVALLKKVEPFNEADHNRISEVKSLVRATVEAPLVIENSYVEWAVLHASEEHGNSVVVTPLMRSNFLLVQP